MRTIDIPLGGATPGLDHRVTVHAFGPPGGRPKAYVQAGLHADEVPGMLAARHLCDLLAALDADGRVSGEVLVVPVANPIGLGQRVLGGPVGRFDLADGTNFNRAYPWLGPDVARRVEGVLDGDGAANVERVRAALLDAVAETEAVTPAQRLKRALLGLAADADLVLDLHCDSEAVVHLYTLTPAEAEAAPLAALLGAEAVLLAEESGDEPFDEACSRPWLHLHRAFPDRPVPLACFAATVELRGQADVDDGLAAGDAAALLGYLRLRGAVEGEAPDVPPPACAATPLAGTEALVSPVPGAVVYHAAPGDRVAAGDAVAEVVDPVGGGRTVLRARASGVLFARSAGRFAVPGRRLGKIAGAEPFRAGKLLSP